MKLFSKVVLGTGIILLANNSSALAQIGLCTPNPSTNFSYVGGGLPLEFIGGGATPLSITTAGAGLTITGGGTPLEIEAAGLITTGTAGEFAFAGIAGEGDATIVGLGEITISGASTTTFNSA